MAGAHVPMEGVMSRWQALIMLLFATPFLSPALAQEKAQKWPAYPAESEITFEWNYSCASSRGCAFSCPGGGGANHVTKLTIYLGRMRLGGDGDQNPLALFYDYSTAEVPRGNGFVINAGLSTLACQVNGMTLKYAGPHDSKSSRLTE
jgi:hypothetical protein